MEKLWNSVVEKGHGRFVNIMSVLVQYIYFLKTLKNYSKKENKK